MPDAGKELEEVVLQIAWTVWPNSAQLGVTPERALPGPVFHDLAEVRCGGGEVELISCAVGTSKAEPIETEETIQVAQTEAGVLRLHAERSTRRLLTAEICSPGAEHLVHLFVLAIERQKTLVDCWPYLSTTPCSRKDPAPCGIWRKARRPPTMVSSSPGSSGQN